MSKNDSMSDYNLPIRSRRPDPREEVPRRQRRSRSRSPDRGRAPLRERNVDLLNGAGSRSRDMTMALALRPKDRTTEDNIQAFLSSADRSVLDPNETLHQQPLNVSGSRRPSIAETEESDADDVTVLTAFNNAPTIVNPRLHPHHRAEARAWATESPTAICKQGDRLDHRANLEAIKTIWGDCPTVVLAPALVPKSTLTTTHPRGPGTYIRDPMDWEADLVKGLRLLAPLADAKDANFWLMKEWKEERKRLEKESMDGKYNHKLDGRLRMLEKGIDKHIVHAVYKDFLTKGHPPKTLAQAQRDNEARKRAMGPSVKPFDPRTYYPSWKQKGEMAPPPAPPKGYLSPPRPTFYARPEDMPAEAELRGRYPSATMALCPAPPSRFEYNAKASWLPDLEMRRPAALPSNVYDVPTYPYDPSVRSGPVAGEDVSAEAELKRMTQEYTAEKKAESSGEYGPEEKLVPVRYPSPQPVLFDSRRDTENMSAKAELMRVTKEWEVDQKKKEEEEEDSDVGVDHVE